MPKSVSVAFLVLLFGANALAARPRSCAALLSQTASSARFRSVMAEAEFADLYTGLKDSLTSGTARDIKSTAFQVFLNVTTHQGELRVEVPIIHVHPAVTDRWTDHTGRGLDLTFAKIMHVISRFIHDELARDSELTRVRVAGKFVLNPEVRNRLQQLGFRRMHDRVVPYLTQGTAVAAVLGTAYYLSGGAKDIVVLGLMASTLYTMLVASSVTNEMWVAEMAVLREPGLAPRLIPVD